MTDLNCHAKCNCHVGAVKPVLLVDEEWYWVKYRPQTSGLPWECAQYIAEDEAFLTTWCEDHISVDSFTIGPRIMPPEEE